MKRLICKLFGHKWLCKDTYYDGDEKWLCTRCGVETIFPVKSISRAENMDIISANKYFNEIYKLREDWWYKVTKE